MRSTHRCIHRWSYDTIKKLKRFDSVPRCTEMYRDGGRISLGDLILYYFSRRSGKPSAFINKKSLNFATVSGRWWKMSVPKKLPFFHGFVLSSTFISWLMSWVYTRVEGHISQEFSICSFCDTQMSQRWRRPRAASAGRSRRRAPIPGRAGRISIRPGVGQPPVGSRASSGG